ncbi:MAG: hypothetical protein H6624_11775 [Bdellovibrionaceae bacterium]|nr:hypothetical protein [Bdellovibrionales bacterium]MCB9085019.1 hypothetical protein [Pseudobdellovibrionaceae bacterium]
MVYGYSRWHGSILGILVFPFLFSCSDVRINPLRQVSSHASKSQLCLRPPENRVRVNKVLFVVDKSGSNAGNGGNPGNDPDDVRRADNIQAFFDMHRNEPYYKWGYIVFGVETNKAHAYINDGSISSPIFGDANQMQAAIDQHRAVPDDGCTPYLAALQLAKRAVENDMRNFPDEDSVYNIFFMSDGFPNDANSAVNCGSTTAVTSSPTDPYILGVKDLIRVAPDRIFFSTAYYALPENDPGRAAADGLHYMADAGGGKFADLQGSDTLNFEELKLGPRPESWILKRMSIYNFNAAYCTDGTRDADSDGDGLCDKDEIDFNNKFADRLTGSKRFDPRDRNSINPKYSDLFSFKFEVLPTGDGLKSCADLEEDQDHDLLNSCEERMLFDNQANGPTPQWTEQMRESGGGTANPKNPDTDGDGFIDSIEYFSFGVKSNPVNYNNIFDRFTGGITAETLMAEHRHPMNPTVAGADSTDFRVTFSGINTKGENCYNVDLRHLPLYRTQGVGITRVSGIPELVHNDDESVILIYYLMTQERNPNGRGYYFFSYKKLHNQQGWSNGLQFDNFSAYKVPEIF